MLKARLLAMFFPGTITKQPQINAAITEVVNELAPSVVHIRFQIGEDWSGDPAIFFRVLLSDEASTAQNLREVTKRVERRMEEKVDFFEPRIIPYFNYRSQAEQSKLQDPIWA
jgi:hypothetical protein